MRLINIKVYTGYSGLNQLKASWRSNWKHYLQEALGLGIFMISACFFGALLEGEGSLLHNSVSNPMIRLVIMATMMGTTALIIFYSPLTAPSGSHINPAVSITFYRLGKMCHWDLLFYIFFQILGGTLAVCIMQALIGSTLTAAPVNSAATVPGRAGFISAMIIEFMIALITMAIVLFSSNHIRFKRHTRVISGFLVFSWVILAGPISGFGMNPSRSFASAFPSGIWTDFWIYAFMPVAGMLTAAELFLVATRKPHEKKLSPSKYDPFVK